MTRVRRHLSTFALVSAVVLAAAGCHKKAPAAVPAPPPAPPPAAPATATTTAASAAATGRDTAAALTEEEIFARKSLEQLNAERPLDDVYFDLDQSTIRDDAKPRLQKDADWLKRWTSTQITVEGHCDSRGSAEYNLGLGSRRATAVKDYLASLGVPAGRMTVVSKGKEAPACADENESCWQQNRRGHFVITAK